MATNNVLQVPMPSAHSSGAPRFDGREVTAFLTSIVQHGANTGITDANELVQYIVQYSSDEVWNLIRYMPEFDPEMTDNAPSMLKDFCEKQLAKSSYTNMSDVETYYRGFAQIAVPLVKKSRITNKERDFYSIAGIPKVIKEWFLTQVPSAKRKRSDPPTIAESIGYLQKRFDNDSLTFEPWAEETQSSLALKATSTLSIFNLDTSRKLPSQVPLAPNTIEDLGKQIQTLNLNLAARTGGNNQQPAFQPTSQGTLNQATDVEQRRCFMCWKAGTHQLGLRNYPDTHTLLAANIIRLDTNTSRYVMAEGGIDLPCIPQGLVGGVADYICAVVRDRAAAGKAQTARSNTLGLSYGASRILDSHNFAVSSLDFMTYDADPVTQTGKDTNVRFDPSKRPEAKGKGRDVPPHMGPEPAPKPAPKAPTAGPSGSSLPTPPTSPINRQDGWGDSRPSNTKPHNDNIVMRDAKKPVAGDKYHITSMIQERADANTMQPVSSANMPLNLLSTVCFAEDDTEIPTAMLLTESGPRYTYADALFDEIKEFLVNYGSAIARVPEGRYFVMSTGTLTIHIGDIVLTAMINTGSELNLASASVPARCSLPVDFEGNRTPRHHPRPAGQPFMQWFAVCIDYERSGGVSLYLWKNGDRKIHPTIVVTITDPQDPCNATAITRNHCATIEEVTDEEEQYKDF
ncbi:hypothetical protein DFH09DRAFT_1076306 [Mycena vulgaris]|nr:hypothetical protein DFH09DRAFT_1076306 [Mycena vulgaris]